jgi:integrase
MNTARSAQSSLAWVAFLSSLATHGHVAASTQNQALSAIVFLYSQVLGLELDWLSGLVRARRPVRLPDGKGRKDRVTMVPARLREALERHLASVRQRHERDLEGGAVGWGFRTR